MLLKFVFVISLLACTLAEKPDHEAEKIDDLVEEASKTVVDTIEEKVDQLYEAGAPASQGNLYYYYYPVAAYPVHEADDKVSASSSSSGSYIFHTFAT